MADVQTSNGFTKIANKIFENIVKLPLNATQWRILAVLWRNTYGYSRKHHAISESYISKATGISKRYISSELKKLTEQNIVKVVKESTYTTPKILAFNKDFDTWRCGSILLQVNKTSTVEQEQGTTVEQSFNTTVEQSFHQQRKNLNKELKKDTYTHDFENFYSLYPRAEEKQRTFKNWKTCLKDHKPEVLIQAGMNYKDKVTQAGTEKQYMKTSANFLGRDKFYQDYINKETPAANKYADVKI